MFDGLPPLRAATCTSREWLRIRPGLPQTGLSLYFSPRKKWWNYWMRETCFFSKVGLFGHRSDGRILICFPNNCLLRCSKVPRRWVIGYVWQLTSKPIDHVLPAHSPPTECSTVLSAASPSSAPPPKKCVIIVSIARMGLSYFYF